MSVTVDQRPLPADSLGLKTVGQVLAHLQRDNRLVVHVLLDGQEPDLSHISSLRSSPLSGHTLYVETAEPRQMALDVLQEVQSHLDEADLFKTDACQLLQQNLPVKAMEKLAGCFSIWQHAQESVLKTAQLLRIDLSQVWVDSITLTDLLIQFTQQLRQIRTALENRDFVSLSDILTYETTQTTTQWRAALAAIRNLIQHPTPSPPVPNPTPSPSGRGLG